jgi:hypothetical protein
MESLRHAVRSHKKIKEELPLIHTSRCELLSPIVSANALEPRLCRVFAEPLTYFSYGRPAYRSKLGSSPGDSLALCPVCFVFKPHVLPREVARVFPCDSGALHDDRFGPMLTSADMGSLELDPTLDAARRYVDLFFPTNSQYYLGRVRKFVGARLDEAARRFLGLLISSGPVQFDDRCSAVEIQVRERIDLPHKLLYVILPREYLDRPAIRNAVFNVWNCEPILYSTVHGDSPSAYYSVLRDRLFARMRDSTRL